MWKKTLLAQACSLALTSPWALAANDEFCIGHLYEEGMEVPGVSPPTASILGSVRTGLQASNSLELQAQATTDGGSPSYFWCVKTSDGSSVGTLEALQADFSQVKYIAPDEIKRDQAVRLILRVADNQGYATGTSLSVPLLKSQMLPPMHDIVVTVKDENGGFIVGAEVKIIILGEIVIVKDEDNDGLYAIPQVPEGSHIIKISKDGYNYLSATIDVDENTATQPELAVQVPSVFDDNGELSQQNIVIVGSYACEENTVSMLNNTGGLFHSFNPKLDAKGVYLNAVDFDRDALTDIAVGGIGKGKDIVLYNANRELIGRIVSNGDDKGVLIAFGDLDGNDNGDFEIFVTNQSKDDMVNMYESNGKAIRALSVLNKKERMSIATGDVNGDGVDELVVVLADKAKNNNVLIFDQNGTLLNTFSAQPNDKKTSGLVVTVADVSGDGKAEIVVAEAERASRYGVAVYNETGELQKRFNAFTGKADEPNRRDDDDDDDDDDGYKHAKCKQSSYKGKGLLLASGDVNGDGKDDIIVSRAGYRSVKLFDGDGQLLNWFTGAEDGYQITALSYGERMGVKLPDIEVIPTAGEVMENVTVEGKPGQARPTLNGQKIRGTVRVANVLIVKVEIEVGANLVVDLGVRFQSRASIPKGLDLRGTCHKKKKNKKHQKLKQGKKTKKRSNQIISQPMDDIEVLDLSTPVVDNAPSVLEDIQVLVGADANTTRRLGLRRDAGIQVTQHPETGDVEVRQGAALIKLTPIGMQQAATDAPARIVIDADGMLHVTTQQGQMVSFYAATHDMGAFLDSLDFDGNLSSLALDDDGQMRAYYNTLPDGYQVGRAHFFSDVLADQTVPDGLHPSSLVYPGLELGVVLVFTDTDGSKRWQWILPTPADRAALEALTEEASSLDKVLLHFDGTSGIPGTVSFVVNAQEYLAVFDYTVRQGASPESGSVEFNPVDATRYEVVYPNGDRQYLHLLSQ